MPQQESEHRFDLGDGHSAEWSCWAPDRELNPQYVGIPDVDRWGLIIFHTDPSGQDCAGFVTLTGDVQRRVAPNATTWTVESWDPLTLSPSVLCSCGDHGFIREGRWVRA